MLVEGSGDVEVISLLKRCPSQIIERHRDANTWPHHPAILEQPGATGESIALDRGSGVPPALQGSAG
jgi:hypothetical protein